MNQPIKSESINTERPANHVPLPGAPKPSARRLTRGRIAAAALAAAAIVGLVAWWLSSNGETVRYTTVPAARAATSPAR